MVEYTKIKYSFVQAFLALTAHASINGLMLSDKLGTLLPIAFQITLKIKQTLPISIYSFLRIRKTTDKKMPKRHVFLKAEFFHSSLQNRCWGFSSDINSNTVHTSSFRSAFPYSLFDRDALCQEYKLFSCQKQAPTTHSNEILRSTGKIKSYVQTYRSLIIIISSAHSCREPSYL